MTTALLAISAGAVVFPQPAHAMEVGCFFTMLSISTLFSLCVALSIMTKRRLLKKFGVESRKQLYVSLLVEIVVLVSVMVALRVWFPVRMLVYLPIAVTINYFLARPTAAAVMTSGRRFALATLTSLAFPAYVWIIGLTAAYISTYLVFKGL